MAEQYGVKETKELLTGMRAMSVVGFRAFKSVPEGEDWKTPANLARIGQEFTRVLMSDPVKVAEAQAAFENVGEVPAEIRDLSIREGVDIGITAVQEVQKAFEEIKAA